MAKVELADRWLSEHGLLKADGEPQPVLKVYSTWVNSARLSLTPWRRISGRATVAASGA